MPGTMTLSMMTLSIMTLGLIVTLSKNSTQYNNSQHYESENDNILPNVTQHNGPNCGKQQK
jgi:hypothetical protein